MIRALIPIFLASLLIAPCAAQDLPPGVIGGTDYNSIPIPVSGYQIYMIGEFHGARETKSLLLAIMTRLHRESGLRDIALEEDQVYQSAARDYVDGEIDILPTALCLRTDVLETIRQFNASTDANERLRVHLVDIDSPIQAIREHLLDLKGRLGAQAVVIPDEQTLRERGLGLVDQMTPLANEDSLRAELETIRSSILAYREGVEIGTSLGVRPRIV